MKDETKNWVLQAEEHYSNGIFLFENSRYSLCVYCCHQALEMIIKGAIVEFANTIPPKIHNLDKLLEISTLKPQAEKWLQDLASITGHYWRVRYQDYRTYVYTNKALVEPIIDQTKEIYLWIKQKLENT